MKVPVVTEILKANDTVAAENHAILSGSGVCVINVMASPGAGKTSTILATIAGLPEVAFGVIEGDIASTIDADKVASFNIPVVQINTGGSCHLDASMIRGALPHLPLDEISAVFVENVGNLICPASYALGADTAMVIASVPEGHDKPYKYPGIFAKADVVLLNKSDMIAAFEFDVDAFTRGVRMVNSDAPIFIVSAKTGEGMDAWLGWLADRMTATLAAATA